MELYFVRHGEPDYAHDCLTAKGRKQAEIVAQRLLEYDDIREIYASPLGRAQETALPYSQATGLPVHTLPYMHELEWSSRNGEEIFANGHPWFCAEEMAKNGWDLTNPNWRDTPYFNNNTATDNIDLVGKCIDEWLASFGMIREGVYYRNTRKDSEPFAAVLFSHGGSGAAAIGRILNLPWPYVASVMHYDHTGISVIRFDSTPGSLKHPQLILSNDSRHIRTWVSDGSRFA